MLLTPGGWGGPSSPKPPSSEHTRARASVRQHSTFGLCSRGQRQKFYRRRLRVESLGSARQGAVAQWQRACGRHVCRGQAQFPPAPSLSKLEVSGFGAQVSGPQGAGRWAGQGPGGRGGALGSKVFGHKSPGRKARGGARGARRWAEAGRAGRWGTATRAAPEDGLWADRARGAGWGDGPKIVLFQNQRELQKTATKWSTGDKTIYGLPSLDKTAIGNVYWGALIKQPFAQLLLMKCQAKGSP